MSLEITTREIQQNQVQSAQEILSQESLRQLKQELSLSTGQILSGRVTSLDGDQIKLLLDSKQTLSAQLTGELPINVGQILSFEVRSLSGQQTELRPLYTNLSGSSTVGTALSEASLPMTDRNVSMVEHMMEEGMSVSKEALLDMVEHLNAHPDVSPATIVQMQKLNLPLDEATIRQFENYQNFEHEIENDVREMNEGLASLPQELIAEGKEDLAFQTLSDVLQMAFEEEGIPESQLPVPETVEQLSALINAEKGAELVGKEGVQVSEKEFLPLEVDKPEPSKELALEDQQVASDSGQGSQTNSAGQEIVKLTAQLIHAYRLDPSSFSAEDKEILKEALNNPLFKDALSGRLTSRLQLSPEDVAKEGKVEELYKKIVEHSAKATEMLNESANSQNALKSAQNLFDNVQFMNHLNEMMAFVQLPLKMSEENAHGDLYVYANKKKLAEKDGNFSALLHLDMEHLGPMDVYVAMQQEKVSTHFYMKDEKTLDFIEANIHILNERLTNKGYHMNTTVSVKDDPKSSVIDEYMKQENEEGSFAPVISTKSFDVRA